MSRRISTLKGKARDAKWKAKEKGADLRAHAHREVPKEAGGASTLFEEEEPPTEPAMTDTEVMALFPAEMWGVDLVPGFDPVLHALQSIQPCADEAAIQIQVVAAERGLDIASHRLAESVLDNYDELTGSIRSLGDVEAQLAECVRQVREARRSLGGAEQELVQGGIQILHKLRQKKLYSEVVDMLLRLKKLLQLGRRCVDGMDRRDYPQMIASAGLYRDSLREFDTIGSLAQRTAAVDDAMESLDGLMEETCMSLCQDFEPVAYLGLLDAYDKLRKLPMLQHNTQRNFEEAIMRVAVSTLFILSSHRTVSGRDVGPEIMPQAAGSRNSKANQFVEIVKQLKPNQVLRTAMKLYSELSAILENMFAFVNWHAHLQPEPAARYRVVGEGLEASRGYIFQRTMDLLGDFIDNVKVTTIAVRLTRLCLPACCFYDEVRVMLFRLRCGNLCFVNV